MLSVSSLSAFAHDVTQAAATPATEEAPKDAAPAEEAAAAPAEPTPAAEEAPAAEPVKETCVFFRSHA